MKAFISSLISGMESVRQAARDAVETARSTPIMAEDFGAKPMTPQIACLQGVRVSDLVVLVLGSRYGAEQPSGLSATHEEWREAKDTKPVLIFVEEGVDREPRQAELVAEVQAWASGRFRAGYRSTRELQIKVGQALIDYERANAVAPADEGEMQTRASALLPANRGGSSQTLSLAIVLVGGPKQRLLRPVEMEDRRLADELHKASLFDETRVFDDALGVKAAMSGSALTLTQEPSGEIRLDEDGSMRMTLAVSQVSGQRRGVYAIVEEEVRRALTSALTYASWVLDRIDVTERLTHIAIAAQLTSGEHMPWMTEAEVAASNGSYSIGMSMAEKLPVRLTTSRAVLRLDRTNMVDDILVPLRRQWPPASRNGSRFGMRIV